MQDGSDFHGAAGRQGRAGEQRPRGLRLLSSKSSRALDKDAQPHRRLAGQCPVQSVSAEQKQRPFRRRAHLIPAENRDLSCVHPTSHVAFFLMLLRQRHQDIKGQKPVKGVSASFTPSPMQTLPHPLQPRLKVTFGLDRSSGPGYGPHPQEAGGRLQAGCVPHALVSSRSPPSCRFAGRGGRERKAGPPTLLLSLRQKLDGCG